MVWGGISTGGKTDLLIIQGNLNAQRYLHEILTPLVIPYAGAVGEGFILMDDNARPHRARVVDQFLEDQGVERMDWPANTPDLNPIEHLWDQLKRAVRRRVDQQTALAMLQPILQEEWAAIPQNCIKNLVQTMRKRCNEVIRRNGGRTSY